MRHCPKCDNRLDEQTDGSTVTVDIAHNGERVREALDKLHACIKASKKDVIQNLRLVVGSGLIREEALLTLHALARRKVIVEFEQEPGNPGAILVRLKR